MSTPNLKVNTPSKAIICEPLQLSWEGGKPSYNISIFSSPDIPDRTKLVLHVTDQHNEKLFSNEFTVDQSSHANTSCINTATSVISESSTSSSPIASTPPSTAYVMTTSTPDSALAESIPTSITSTLSTSQHPSSGGRPDTTSSLSAHSNPHISRGTIGAIAAALMTLATLIIASILVRRARRRKSIHDASVLSWPPEVYIETFTSQDSDIVSSTEGLSKAATHDGAQTSTVGSVSDTLSPTAEKAPAASTLQKSVVGDIRW